MDCIVHRVAKSQTRLSDFHSLTHSLCRQGFPGGSVVKNLPANAGVAGDSGSIPGSGRSPGEGKGYALQYSGLENSMDCIVYGVAKSWTRLNNFHSHFTKGMLWLV